MRILRRNLEVNTKPEEAFKFFKNLRTPSHYGRIETTIENFTPTVQGHSDGQGGVLCNGRITRNDYDWYCNKLGKQATDLITRYHTIP